MKKISDLKIKIFADGADKKGMLEMYDNPLISGFTTNPTLMKLAGIKDYKLLKRPWGLLNFKLLEYNLLYNVKLETPVIYDLNIWKSLQYSTKQIPSHTLDEPDSWRVDNFGSYHIAADRTWDLEMDEMDLQDLEL